MFVIDFAKGILFTVFVIVRRLVEDGPSGIVRLIPAVLFVEVRGDGLIRKDGGWRFRN